MDVGLRATTLSTVTRWIWGKDGLVRAFLPQDNLAFFLLTFLQKGSERCVLIDFDLQNYSSPVLWG